MNGGRWIFTVNRFAFPLTLTLHFMFVWQRSYLGASSNYILDVDPDQHYMDIISSVNQFSFFWCD